MSNDWGTNEPNTNQPMHDPFSDSVAGLKDTAYEPTFDDVFDNIKLLPSRIMGPTFMAWIGIAAINLVFSVVLYGGYGLLIEASQGTSMDMGVLTGGSLVLIVVGSVWTVIVMGITGALYAPIKIVMVEGPNAIPDMGALWSSMQPVLLNCILTSFLLVIMVSVGFLFCVIPGIVVGFFVMMSNYYAAQGASPTDAIQESYRSVMAYPLLALGAGVVYIGCGIAAGVVGFFIQALAATTGQFAMLVTQIGSWGFGLIVGYILLVVFTAFFLTMDTADTGENIARVFE